VVRTPGGGKGERAMRLGSGRRNERGAGRVSTRQQPRAADAEYVDTRTAVRKYYVDMVKSGPDPDMWSVPGQGALGGIEWAESHDDREKGTRNGHCSSLSGISLEALASAGRNSIKSAEKGKERGQGQGGTETSA
jgi:hypothetical protein